MNESKRVVSEAASRGVTLRIVGGIAVYLHSHSDTKLFSGRVINDADFFGHRSETRRLKQLFSDLGYEPNFMFNSLHGRERLMFLRSDGFHVDVFLDKFEMCHDFDFSDRLNLNETTLSVSDLLLTKLQVVELNRKDIDDTVTLLRDHELADSDDRGELINKQYIAGLCSVDWGTCETLVQNIRKIHDNLDDYEAIGGEDVEIVRSKLQELRRTIEVKPKSLGWKARSKIGRRMKWHADPTVRE